MLIFSVVLKLPVVVYTIYHFLTLNEAKSWEALRWSLILPENYKLPKNKCYTTIIIQRPEM